MTGESAEQFIREWGVTAVFVGTVLDHTGLPVPLIVGMALASQGWINPWAVAAAAFAACLLSDVIAYLIGRHFAAGLFRMPRFGPKIERACTALAARPQLAVFIGRFVPAIGKYAPVAVGAAGKRLVPLLPTMALGSALYVAAFAVAAWAGWDAVTSLRWETGLLSAGFAALVVVVVVASRKALRPREGQRETP